MDYRTKTFTVGEGTITVRESVGMDIIDAAVIYPKLTYSRESKRAKNRAGRFVQAVLRSTVDADLGFSWVDVDSDDLPTQAAFDQWQKLSANTLATWELALSQVDKATEDPKEPVSTTSTV